MRSATLGGSGIRHGCGLRPLGLPARNGLIRETLSIPNSLGRRFPFNFKRVPSQVPGRCFFPGVSGLWKEHEEASWAWQSFPGNSIFVIGQDLDSEHSFTTSTLMKGYESGMGAWAGVKQSQDKAGLPVAKCFFTNFLPGLRIGNTSE